MIKDIFFDADHDMTLEGQDLKFADESNIVKQRLTNGLQLLLGEWFLDNTKGIPYTQTIYKVGTSLSDVYDIIRRFIIETEDVASLKSLNLTPDADERGLRIDFEAIESDGTSTGLITIQV